jgi:hypothetical protein
VAARHPPLRSPFYPGLALVVLGSIGTAFLFFGPVMITARFGLGEHTFLVSAIATLLGAQLIGFGIMARHLGAATGLLARSPWLARLLSAFPLERGLVIALAIAGCGLAGCGWSVWQWAVVDFGPLTAPAVLRVLAASLVLVAIAVQMAFTLFLLAVIDMPAQRRDSDKP